MNPRFVAAAFGALFVYSACMQLDDPDPARWIAVYGAAAILSLLAAVQRPAPLIAPRVLAVLAAAGLLYVAGFGVDDSVTMTPLPGNVLPDETVRESLGLALVAGVMAWLGWGQSSRSS